jgi:serine protease AprX
MPVRIIALLALGSLASFARPHPRVSRELNGLDPNSTVNVIVQYVRTPDKTHTDRIQGHGGRHRQNLDLVKGALVSIAAGKLADLADDPDVALISPDHVVTGSLDRVVGSINGYTLANALGSTVYSRGAGIGIAFVDSGIYPSHPDFKMYGTGASRIVYTQSFVDSDPSDKYGHGTHVIGIAAGMDSSNTGATRWFWGTAPSANIISLKALDANGTGTDSSVINAINKAIQLKSTYNIRVLNLSLGRPVTTSYKTDPLCQAVEAAWKAGITVVVAAGNFGRDNSMSNNGYGTITAPGNDPYVITVGAVNSKDNTDRTDDTIATYSSKGPTAIDHIVKPDLVAPGNRVVSYQSVSATLEKSYPSNIPATNTYLSSGTTAPSPYYFTLSGTSMAAPVVSGMAATLIQKRPSLTPDQVKAILMKTAWRGFPATTSTFDPSTNTTYMSSHDVFTIGAGLLDAYAAYMNTDTPTGSATSPVAIYDSTTKTVKISLTPLTGTTLVWGTTGTFATSLVWGTNISGTSLVWGTSMVWGTSTMQGFSMVWGTSSPWAASAPNGEAVSIAIKGEN